MNYALQKTVIALLFAMVVGWDSAHAQIGSEQTTTVTLYSPRKYKIGSNRMRPDFSRASVSFDGRGNSASGSWDLSYGNISRDHDLDWFLVSDGGGSRNVIKDLGKWNWSDRLQIPSLPPLPELRSGESRNLSIDVSGKAGADGVDGYDGEDGIDGGMSARHQWPTTTNSLPATNSKAPARKPIANLPVVAKAVTGHMYVVHVADNSEDFYVLVHVDRIISGDNCTISWKRLSNASVTGSRSNDPRETPRTGGSAAIVPSLVSGPSTAVSRRLGPPRLKAFGSSLARLKWDAEKQAAIEVGEAQPNPEIGNEDVVRVETRLVVSDVRVLDEKGRVVEGLARSDFQVAEDSEPQEISHFSLGNNQDVGRRIVLLLDYSASLLPYVEMSTKAAGQLVDQLGPHDLIAIVSDDVDLVVDFTDDKNRLRAALDSLSAKALSGHAGKSRQFSALFATLRELFNGEDVRPIIIFQTDGDQFGMMPPLKRADVVSSQVTQFGLADLTASIEKSRRAVIYSVIPGLRLLGLPEDEQMRRLAIMNQQSDLAAYELRRKRLPNPSSSPAATVSPRTFAAQLNRRLQMNDAAGSVAEVSGGRTFFLESPSQANEIYAQILSDLAGRYVIGYYPANKKNDGKRHKVTIVVRNHPEYIVEGRKAYIASDTRR